MISLTVLILVSSSFQCSISLEITSWSIINENGSIVVKNVSSPIDVYSALFQNGIIDWPLKGYNDVLYRWIAYDNWTFISKPFRTPSTKRSSLFLSGLDSYPLVILNGNIINITTSEFSSSEISINPNMLKISDNILQLKFTSPPLIAKVKNETYPKNVVPDCWPNLFHGECHINFLRKTQSSFGWDWGPAVPSMGIRGKVVLRFSSIDVAVISGVRFVTNSGNDCKTWKAQVFVKLKILRGEINYPICVMVKVENLHVNLKKCFKTTKSETYEERFTFSADTPPLKLWWPFEFGTPTLYKLDVLVSNGVVLLDKFSKYVGFKNVQVDQSLISGHTGRHFRFIINCKPMFMKGTNWVPRSYLTLEWENKLYLEFLLSSVRNANINTIRVWGGGRPETELFYSITDRLGIMVWHDLMFAGSLYPCDPRFNKEVYDEVSGIVWNLQRHPSILVWAGNNEVELLIADGWYKKSMNPFDISDYYETFSLVIKPLVNQLDPFTPFLLSSPSNGIESEHSKGVSKDPQSVYYGDVHFYLYSGELWDERSYPITRMTTEFGFQSFPSVNTWTTIIGSEEDFDPDGSLMNHRQHLIGGLDKMKKVLQKYFGSFEIPGGADVRIKYAWFSYLSQINQAIILKVHINRLRSSRCNITKNGEGFTSGAMFWQLNDNWVAPSWSSIESTGQWKLAHYYVKSAFSVERIIVAVHNETINVKISLPDSKHISNYSAMIKCIDISKNVSVAVTGQHKICIRSTNSQCNVVTILTMSVFDFLKQCQCFDVTKCLISATLENNGTNVSNDETLLVKPKELYISENVSKDNIKLNIINGMSVCIISLKQMYVHLFVTLTTNVLGSFSKNGFHSWLNQYNVTFYPYYFHGNSFFNCSNLQVEVLSLNMLFANRRTET